MDSAQKEGTARSRPAITQPVSILVIMDSAQKVIIHLSISIMITVSILVIMDSAQKATGSPSSDNAGRVSILVIMDSAQKGFCQMPYSRFLFCFNPCYNG